MKYLANGFFFVIAFLTVLKFVMKTPWEGGRNANVPSVALSSDSWQAAYANTPLPEYGAPSPDQVLAPDIHWSEIQLSGNGQPGQSGRLWRYLPEGKHGPRSLACVLIAPAGSNLLQGNRFGGEDERREHLPYVKQGMAVVGYELDGAVQSPQPSDAELTAAYGKFVAAQAGLINARNALEYVLKNMPEVDPDHIYAAGHSSAGTMALLFAEHEPRIRGVLAYAPVSDLEEHFAPHVRLLESSLPNAREFIRLSSPRTHEAKLTCPVFLFQSQGDSVVPYQQTGQFVNRLRSNHRDVQYEFIPSGDHYDSMLSAGIPAGLRWLQVRSALKMMNEMNAKENASAVPAQLSPNWPELQPPQSKKAVDDATEIGGHMKGTRFTDVDSADGSVLIGFEVGLGKWESNDVVVAICPIFCRANGEEVFGQRHGTNWGRLVVERARAGYAIGAITAKGMAMVDGFSITYMKVGQGRLDTSDTYKSQWIGGRGGAGELTLGGDGRIIKGIFGHEDKKDSTSLGLLR